MNTNVSGTLYQMIEQKGLRLILIDQDNESEITLAHIKTLMMGTKAAEEIAALEKKSPVERLVNTSERTDLMVLQQTDQLARLLMKLGDLTFNAEDDNDWVANMRHPRARWAWKAACECQKLLTNTDPDDALYLLDEVKYA